MWCIRALVCLLVACLTSQQHASVSQGQIYSDNCTYCHTEIEVAGQTFYLTQSQYTDTGPTSPSTDPIMPGAWQGSHRSANFEVTGVTRPGKIPSQAGFELRTFRFRGGRLNHLANEEVGDCRERCPGLPPPVHRPAAAHRHLTEINALLIMCLTQFLLPPENVGYTQWLLLMLV